MPFAEDYLCISNMMHRKLDYPWGCFSGLDVRFKFKVRKTRAEKVQVCLKMLNSVPSHLICRLAFQHVGAAPRTQLCDLYKWFIKVNSSSCSLSALQRMIWDVWPREVHGNFFQMFLTNYLLLHGSHSPSVPLLSSGGSPAIPVSYPRLGLHLPGGRSSPSARGTGETEKPTGNTRHR